MTLFPDWALEEKEKIQANNLLIRMVAPSVVEPGEPFSMRLSAVGADQMPVEFPLRLQFMDGEAWAGLPAEVELRGEEEMVLNGLSLPEPGAYWLWASFGDDPTRRVASNPVLVQDHPRERIYFGDLHIHSIDGMCQPYLVKEPRFAFEYIRHVSFLDFAAVTDHVAPLTPDKWAKQRRLVREYDEPGVFVPFLGFESTHVSGRGGDNNGYYRDYEGDYFWVEGEPLSGPNVRLTLADLWRFLDDRPYESMTIPHHTGRALKYRSWDDGWYNPKKEWLYEIYSCWGSSEERQSRYPLFNLGTDQPAYFRDALVRGCRFGVIASGDDHITMPNSQAQQGRPGSPRLNIYRHKGLAAVFASELERRALWEGFRQRRTYATTFDRSIALWQSDGAVAGEEIPVGAGTRRKRRLSLSFLAGTPIYRQVIVEIIRNDRVVCRTDRLDAGAPVEVEYVDEEPFDDVAIRGARFCQDPFVSYYARIEYPLGGTVWTSPIWFTGS